jgi:hypothetical protein
VRLQAESRKTGRHFKTVVNDYLRAGLAQRRAANEAAPFRVEPVRMGALLPGRSNDNTGTLLEDAEVTSIDEATRRQRSPVRL